MYLMRVRGQLSTSCLLAGGDMSVFVSLSQGRVFVGLQRDMAWGTLFRRPWPSLPSTLHVPGT